MAAAREPAASAAFLAVFFTCSPVVRALQTRPPNCSLDMSERLAARYAIVLFGSVSTRSGRVRAPAMLKDDQDWPAALFVQPGDVRKYLRRNVERPSGGIFHYFIHCVVPSRQLQGIMLRVFEPVSAQFLSHYDGIWARWLEDQKVRMGAPGGAARYQSIASALQHLRAAEMASNARYTRILLVRPDVYILRTLNLSHYCPDHVYVNCCERPCYQKDRPADFHFVLTSTQAEMFANITQHRPSPTADGADKAANVRGAHDPNACFKRFVFSTMGVPLASDDIVCGLHEDVARKLSPGQIKRLVRLEDRRAREERKRAKP